MRNFSPEELGEIRTIYRQAANPTAQIGDTGAAVCLYDERHP